MYRINICALLVHIMGSCLGYVDALSMHITNHDSDLWNETESRDGITAVMTCDDIHINAASSHYSGTGFDWNSLLCLNLTLACDVTCTFFRYYFACSQMPEPKQSFCFLSFSCPFFLFFFFFSFLFSIFKFCFFLLFPHVYCMHA